MANFFYFDANSNKNGPYNEQQLQSLAAQGIITPTTPLETDAGHKGTAGQIRGLFNAPPTQSAMPTARQSTSQSVPVTIEKGGKGSLLITFIGIVVVSAIGWAGWKIIDSTTPEGVSAPEINVSELLPAEQIEADSYITKYGRDAILHYLEDTHKDTDKDRILRYVKFFVSQGAGVDVVKANDKFGYTPLYWAAAGGDIDVVKFLVSEGASVNAKNGTSSPPLHGAVLCSDIEIIEFLLSNGADVNAKNSEGWTPLYGAACKEGSIPILELLISKGADVTARDKNDGTPLHGAVVVQDNTNVIEFLISKGGDVNAKNKNGFTPIHFAASDNKNVGIVEFLVAKGADATAKTSANKTPLDLAKTKKNTEVVDYLSSLPEVQEQQANLL